MSNKIDEIFNKKNITNILVIVFTMILIFSWVGIVSTTLSESIIGNNSETIGNEVEIKEDEVFLSSPPLKSPSIAISNLIIALLGLTLIITIMGMFTKKES